MLLRHCSTILLAVCQQNSSRPFLLSCSRTYTSVRCLLGGLNQKDSNLKSSRRDMSSLGQSSSSSCPLLEASIYAANVDVQIQHLEAQEDAYDGVIVDPACLPSDVPTFVAQLRSSLTFWKSKGKKGVWLKLPIQSVAFVAPAVEAGFTYHHAEPSYLMLIHWIPETPCTLPANASHQVGVGAFVLNDKEEVLVVQEKNGPLKNLGVWKIPTGVVNQGEDIFQGAIREVKEETGINAVFEQVLGFRQSHHVQFGKSDMFLICFLRPTSSKIVIQESEIQAAQWMPLDKYMDQPFFKNSRSRERMMEICIRYAKGEYQGFSHEASHHGKDAYLYCSRI